MRNILPAHHSAQERCVPGACQMILLCPVGTRDFCYALSAQFNARQQHTSQTARSELSKFAFVFVFLHYISNVSSGSPHRTTLHPPNRLPPHPYICPIPHPPTWSSASIPPTHLSPSTSLLTFSSTFLYTSFSNSSSSMSIVHPSVSVEQVL